jgi:RND family efflux transporter MFP subunit
MRIAAIVALIIFAPGCTSQQAAEDTKVAPAGKVVNPVKEGDLATVVLSPEAETRLGIATAPVEYASVTRSRTFGGEVVLPPDSAITVSAPVTGTILAAADSAPAAGMIVKKGQPIFRLLPLLPPERHARTMAERELTDAVTREAAAKQKLDRAEQLLRDKAGSERQVEEAREQLQLAESALKAARKKLERVVSLPLEADTSVAINSPEDGMVQKVHVAAGQKVAAPAVLFEIAGLNTTWVRVPIYVGDLGSIDRKQAAKVHNLGDTPGSPILSAKPIAAPPSANPNAATVDLYFQLPTAGGFRPGQRVGVTLTLLGTQESLVVPNSAILRDIHGGEWVYENIASQQFMRRRVEVRYITGSQAVLARGPAQGTPVVVTGAAELFSTEFSTSK